MENVYGGTAKDIHSTHEEDNTNTLTIYWNGSDNLNNCDVWAWWDGKAGSGYRLQPCEYGSKCTINVPKHIEHVGFIVRTNCSDPCGSSWGTAYKDWHEDRTATITGKDTNIYLKTGDGNQYLSDDNGATLKPILVFTFAEMLDRNVIRFHVSPKACITSNSQITVVDENGENLDINETNPKNTLAETGIVVLKDNLDISKSYRISIEGYGEKEVVPTHIFDTQWFIDNFTYDGDDLGAILTKETSSNQGSTTFKVWAPTAQNVSVNLFHDGHEGEAFANVPMTKGTKGIWSATIPASKCHHGTYYTYTVTTTAGSQEAVDPYAKAVGVNGDRGMVVDMDLTNPESWNDDRYVDNIDSYSDAIVWEVHVRDFSNKDPQSKYKGKYLAFTETGHSNQNGTSPNNTTPIDTTPNDAIPDARTRVPRKTPIGMDHVKELGITHIQLNPVFDFATVDEAVNESANETPQFNWGYDPKNFNVPEGSYSTDPYHGEVRINEFKRMVQAIHRCNIGIVMDVVYNHTYDANSNFNRIVPYYYYRYNFNGTNSNGSGCGNETASQRTMFRKFMVDSIRFWATEYHIDSFRFDLMAIHDTETMQAVERVLHSINPKALLYGEGWAGGVCALDSNRLANQHNIAKVHASHNAIGSIAVFNDVIRDGLKGNVFEVQSRGYINGGACYDSANKVAFGLKGGVGTHGIYWEAKDAMVVNYMSSHDNNTLWDKLKLSNINATKQQLLAMNRLGAACVLLSRGMPFMLAGEELLRSKNGDGNSYNASDDINNIDWQALTSDEDALAMTKWYKDLIALRKANPFIGNSHVSCNILDGNVIEALYHYDGMLKGYALFNPNEHAIHHSLPHGQWKVLLQGQDFALENCMIEGKAIVPEKGVLLVTR